MPYREVITRDRWRAMGYTLLAIVVITATGAILVHASMPLGLLVWLAIFVPGSLFLLVGWHANHTAYRCPVCGSEFEIAVLTDFAGPQIPDKKYLKCPQCGKRNWATVLMKIDEQDDHSVRRSKAL